MASQAKNDEDDYNSSSDEDYDPEKDEEVDPQDEIDDAEGGEEDLEDLEALTKDAGKQEKSGKGDSGAAKEEEDVDALFAELTGLDPTQYGKTEEKKEEEVKVYPKSSGSEPSESASSSTPSSSAIYPSSSSNSAEKPAETAQSGKKRVGLLDAAKTMAKRSKTSVLDKSDSDWKTFKTEQNIKEDLESHNRGKGGYLNKMDFLNRTDNRQFEKERAFRATARKDTGN